MKFSLESIKISIAGAKLSHLVQKDKIWDHGSMTEQARIIFYLVHKSKSNANMDSLKKCVTDSCFVQLENEMYNDDNTFWKNENPVIRELAIIEVSSGKTNRPDMFTAIIRGYWRKGDEAPGNIGTAKFCMHWSFVRQGEWWLLNSIKPSTSIF